MTTVIAVDLDGTLLDDQGRISDLNRRAISRAHDAGAVIVIATGRSPHSARAQLEFLGVDGYIIALNGAAVIDSSGQVVSSSRVEPQIVTRALEVGERHGATVTLSAPDLDHRAEAHPDPTGRIRDRGPGTSLFRSVSFADARQIAGSEEILKVSVLQPDALLLERARADLVALGIPVVSSDPRYVEVTDAGVSKGAALRSLVGELAPAEVLAFGDQENDIEMIRYATVGLAMGHAAPALKEVADGVIGNNNDSAVGHAILSYLENPESLLQNSNRKTVM